MTLQMRLLAAVFVAASTVPLAGSQPRTSGAAILSGVVFDDLVNRPIGGAVVIARAGGAEVRRTIADTAGRFVFEDVPRGRMVISAAKQGYVRAPWSPGLPPAAVVVESGSYTLELRLRRAGAIEGVVRDQAGRPLAGTRVSAFPCDLYGACELGPQQSAGVTTDAHGRFRLFDLPAGSYLIAADTRMRSAQPMVLAPPDAIAWAEAQLGAVPSPSRTSPPPPFGPAVPVVPVTTFFPDAISSREAGRVEVSNGGTRDGIDITVQFGKPAAISGTILDVQGRPTVTPNVSVLPNERTTLRATSTMVMVRPDGSFETALLPPGRYRIGASGTPEAGRHMLALAEVIVEGENVSGVILRMEPSFIVSGTISGTVRRGTRDLSDVRIDLRRANVVVREAGWDTASTTTNTRGEFVLPSLPAGVYEITCRMPQSAQRCTGSAIVNGEDVFDSVLRVERDARNLRINIDEGGSIRGSLHYRDGTPAGAYAVVLFPADRKLWKTGSRRIRVLPVASDGTFEATAVLAGDYRLAPAGIDDSEIPAIQLLESLMPTGVHLTITSGRVTHDLVID